MEHSKAPTRAEVVEALKTLLKYGWLGVADPPQAAQNPDQGRSGTLSQRT